MNKIIILSLATGIAMASLSAVAATDSQYPASDFQPKVVYIDKDAVKPSASSGNTKCKAEDTVAKAEPAEFDPKYPAANFQPKVIYP